MIELSALLRALWDVGIGAVAPELRTGEFILPPPQGRTLLVGAGKAAASMAAAYCAQAPAPAEGLIVVPYGHRVGSQDLPASIECLEAAHPVPDEVAVEAGRRVLDLAHRAAVEDRLIFLVSGGASALLESPVAGISLADIQTLTRQLLRSGATISEINAVRRQLSSIKGGGLAVAAAPAEIQLLAISDVPGDVLADIGSGPCSPDPGGVAAARAVVRRYHCRLPVNVRRLLFSSKGESRRDGAEPFVTHASIMACADDALAAVASAVEARGFRPLVLGSAINSPATDLAREHASLVRSHQGMGQRIAIISGGETTVAVPSNAGRGGRNTTYLLRLLMDLRGLDGVAALAADTDGIDGQGDHAGAWFLPASYQRAQHLGLDGEAMLARAGSAVFFDALKQLLITGPTLTNVNDLRIILVNTG